jgi:hypothetical protein
MRFRKHHESNRYWSYRHEHFLPDEAKELSHWLKRLDYNELRIMVNERRQLWRQYNEQVVESHWSPTKISRKWKEYVHFWYLTEGYRPVKVTLRQFFAQEKEVWVWFNATRESLPEEKRYPKNASHSRMSDAQRESKAQHEAVKEQHKQMQETLMKRAAKSPERDKELTELATRVYGFTGKSLYKTAQRRGMLEWQTA